MSEPADLIATIDAEREEQERRQLALEGLVGPNVSPIDAAANAVAADRLGMDRDELALAPSIRSEADRGRFNDALSAGHRIEGWIAERQSNAAIARPDLDRLARAEVDWWSLGVQSARDNLRLPSWEEMQENARRNLETRLRGGTEADLEQIRRNREGLDRFLHEVRPENLSSADWWRVQGEAAKRNTAEAWRRTEQFFRDFPDMWHDVTTQFGVSARMQERADINWRIMMGEENPGDRDRLAELRAIEEPEPKTLILGPMAQSSVMTIRGALGGVEGGLKTGLLGATVAAGTVGALGQAGPQAGLPEEFVTMPAAAVWGFRQTVGPGAMIGSGQQMMRTEGGLFYDEVTDPRFVDEDGRPLDPELARNAAIVVGMINGGLEVFSLRTALSKMPGGSEFLAMGSDAQRRAAMRNLLRRRDFRTALQRWLMAAGEVGLTEGITEFSQESVSIQGMRTSAWLSDQVGLPLPSHEQGFQRALYAGYFGFQAGVGFGALGGGVTFATVDAPRALQTNRDALRLEQLASHVQEMQMRGQAPGVLEEALDRVTRNSEPEVYIDARRVVELFQSIGVDPNEGADAIPGLGRDALNEALEADSTVAIPTSVVGARLMGTPAWDGPNGLKDHARLTPGGFSPYELEQIRANEPELMREVEGMVRDQERAGRQAEVYQAIEDGIARALDEVGMTVSDANRAQARVFATAIMNQAKQEGINPIALYEQFFGDIRRENDAKREIEPVAGEITQQTLGDIAVEATRIKENNGLQDLRLTLNEDRGEIVLDLITVEKSARSKGAGAAAMRELVEYADRHGLRVVLNPSKRGGGLGTRSRGANVAFFQQFGFVENKGATKDAAVTHQMYRPASGTFRVRQETQATQRRFDGRLVDPEEARAGRPAIPRYGTPDFEALLERALDKRDDGLGLSVLEEWALERAGHPLETGVTGEPLYQGDDKPVRAGPLPPRGTQAVNAGSETNPASARGRVSLSAARLAPEAEAALKRLMAERARLSAEINSRMENERDLPEMVEARKDALAMRNLAYCAARGMIRRAATVAGAGAVVGSTLAAAGSGAILAPSDIADGTMPPGAVVTPPADRRAVRAEAQAPAVEPVTLPEQHPEEVIAALPAEQAAEAVAPPSLSQASAVEALNDPDLPIATNNRAAPPLSAVNSEP